MNLLDCPARGRIYMLIDVSIEQDGYSPTVREIAQAVGLSSPNTVHWHLSLLESGGLIFRIPGRHYRAWTTMPSQRL